MGVDRAETTLDRTLPRPSHPEAEQAGDGGCRLGAAAAAGLIALVAGAVALAVGANGEFAYPLDDPYIHLRLAENLVGTGVLGVNPGEFASAASSIAWPLLLAPLTWLLDTAVGIPLVLATAAGAVTLVLLDPWARRRGVRPWLRVSLLIGMVVVVPLVLMSLTGMEHSLQVGLSILLVSLGVDAAGEDGERRGRPWAIGLAAFALAATRLEIVFVAPPLLVLLALHRRWRSAVGLCVGSALPLLAIVAIDLGQGWAPLPASVSAKTLATRDGIARILPDVGHIEIALTERPRLLAVALLVALLLCVGRWLGPHLDATARRWGAIALSIAALHVCWSQTGWLFRYEAYLVALCLCAAALLAESVLRHRDELALGPPLRGVVAAAAVALVVVAVVDGVRVTRYGLTGMREIHRQQVQMARFAAASCPGCRVVVNDIGAVSLYGDVTVTDCVGLADREVIEAKLRGDDDAATIDRIARDEGAGWAMIYPDWEHGVRDVPASWELLGTWSWPTHVVVGGKDVAFYAIDPTVADELRERFEAWPAPPGATAVPAR